MKKIKEFLGLGKRTIKVQLFGINHKIDHGNGVLEEYCSNGNKIWYKNGKLHRENGPAIEWTNGNKHWYINGLLHRENGSAVEFKNGSKHWYLNGKEYTEEEYLSLLNKKIEQSQVINQVNLPIVSDGVLKEIKLLYKEIQNDFDLLDIEKQFEIQNIYQKRLPQLLTRYQNIQQKYSNGLEDSNKNPNTMLHSSLIDIHAIFNRINETINKHKVEQLDISSRYIKEIKNKMA